MSNLRLVLSRLTARLSRRRFGTRLDRKDIGLLLARKYVMSKLDECSLDFLGGLVSCVSMWWRGRVMVWLVGFFIIIAKGIFSAPP